MTSNLPFTRWRNASGAHAVTSALINRIVHHAEVLTLKGTNYQLEDTKLTLPSEKTESKAQKITRCDPLM